MQKKELKEHKNRKLLIIYWEDIWNQGRVGFDKIKLIPDLMLNVGWLVERNKDYIVIAHHLNLSSEKSWDGDIWVFPKKIVKKIIEMKIK